MSGSGPTRFIIPCPPRPLDAKPAVRGSRRRGALGRLLASLARTDLEDKPALSRGFSGAGADGRPFRTQRVVQGQQVRGAGSAALGHGCVHRGGPTMEKRRLAQRRRMALSRRRGAGRLDTSPLSGLRAKAPETWGAVCSCDSASIGTRQAYVGATDSASRRTGFGRTSGVGSGAAGDCRRVIGRHSTSRSPRHWRSGIAIGVLGWLVG
jgi:hypothetical protein